MKKTVSLLLISLSLLHVGCSRSFYYTNDCSTDKLYTIDSTSNVYIGKLYLNDNKEKTKDSLSTSGTENLLIEVRYLIINPNNEVLFIATTPSKYIYDKSTSYLIHSKKNSYPNTFFFNTFFFGKVKMNENNNLQIEFKKEKLVQEWNFNLIDKEKTKLISINNYKVKKVLIDGTKTEQNVFVSSENVALSFYSGVEFSKINYFHYLSFNQPYEIDTNQEDDNFNDQTEKTYLAYDENCVLKEFKSKYKQYPRANNIYLNYSGKKLKYIFIPFNQDLVKNYHSIKFKSNRVRFLNE